MTTPSTAICARVLLGELSMHFNMEAKVRGFLCIAMKGSLWRSVPPVRRVRSRSCCNYYGPLDCARSWII